MTKNRRRSPTHLPPSTAGATRALLVSSLLAAGLAGCSSGGGDVDAPGGGGTPAGPVLSVDFDLRRDLALAPAPLSDALVLDWNGDGLADLAQTSFLDQRVTVAIGNPDGSWTPAVVHATAGAAWRLAAGDLDGDGDVDLAVLLAGAGLDPVAGSRVGVQGFLRDAGGQLVDGGVLDYPNVPFDLAVLPAASVPGGAAADEVLLARPVARRVARVSFAGGAPVEVGVLAQGPDGTGAPQSLALLDVGGEGLVDVLVGEIEVEDAGGGPAPDRVVAHQNTGAGFDPAIVVPVAHGPVVEAVADLDANGMDDLAVAQLGAEDVLVLPNDPAGLLAPVAVTFGSGSSSVLAGDLDGDGLVDLAATLLDEECVSVRLATAPLVLGPADDYNVGPLPRALGVLSAPGDAALDLLCASHEDLSLLLGHGDGTFRAAHGFRAGIEPVLVQAADLDLDGDVDVVAQDQSQKQLDFLENLGDGTFAKVDVVPVSPTADELPGSFVLADVDADGLADVVVAIRDLGVVRVVPNPGAIVDFSTVTPDEYPLGASVLGVAAADLDGDQDLDLAVTTDGPGAWALHVLLGAGDGTFVPEPPLAIAAFRPAAVVAHDLDGDGDRDLLVSGDDGTLPTGQNPVVAVLEGDGAGGFTVESVLPTTTLAHSIAFGDFDEDGRADAVVGQPTKAADAFLVLRNVSGAAGIAFDAEAVTVGEAPGTVVVADLDDDGHDDVLTATSQGELRIALGAGDGTFPDLAPPAAGDLAVPLGTYGLVLADVDGDELGDLVMATPESHHVWIGRNVSTVVAPEP